MKIIFSTVCLLTLVAACGTKSQSQAAGTIQTTEDKTAAPSLEVLHGLMERWNMAASEFLPMNGLDVIPRFASCFYWKDLRFFRLPTFCGGSATAYLTFDKIVDRFFTSTANLRYLEDNNLMNYPLEVGTLTQPKTMPLKQLKQ